MESLEDVERLPAEEGKGVSGGWGRWAEEVKEGEDCDGKKGSRERETGGEEEEWGIIAKMECAYISIEKVCDQVYGGKMPRRSNQRCVCRVFRAD